MTLSSLVKTSRPRFWVYVLGPYLVGAAALKSPDAFASLSFWLWATYFTLPGNLFIYGINDVFDYETDVLNAKKRGYEAALPPDRRRSLLLALALLHLPYLAAAFVLPPAALGALGAFLLLSLFYSAPPVRAKARPFLDAPFNALYLCPGYLSFFLSGGKALEWRLLLAGWAWVMAMQLYSAVPDISADRESDTPTTATALGPQGALWLCLTLYLAAAALAFSALGGLAALLGAVYASLMLLSLHRCSEERVLRIYRYFPMVNTLCGMAIFFRALL